MNSSDGASAALRAAAERWRRAGDDPEDNGTYVKWAVPGGYSVPGGTLGAPSVDFVVWVAAAVGSGVLGNAAYDAMKKVITTVAERLRTAGSLDDSGPVLNDNDVIFLARLAVRVALLHNGLDGSRAIEVTSAAWAGDDSGGRGVWTIEAHTGDRAFRFTIPDRRPEELMAFGNSREPG